MNYGSMRDAVVRYARDVAALPSFSVPTSAFTGSAFGASPNAAELGSVLKVMAVDNVDGQVLPRAQNTWMALLPFEDTQKLDPEDVKKDKMKKRRQFLELLVKLAACPDFQWGPMMDCGVTNVHDNPEFRSSSSKSSFWIDLIRSLCPTGRFDTTRELERNLIVLSREPMLRFLLCVPSDPSRLDVAELLDYFLSCPETPDSVYDNVLRECGLQSSRDPSPEKSTQHVTVEFGLTFTEGTVTHGFLAKLLAVLEANQSTCARSRHDIHFRLTTLRFGRGCIIQSKAMEVLGQIQQFAPSVSSVQVSNILDVKPASLRSSLLGLTDPQSGIKNLTIGTLYRFPAVASAERGSKTTRLSEMAVPFEPTQEHGAWLARALFHMDSDSSVASLCLRVSSNNTTCMFFTREWIDSFTRTLQSATGRYDLAGFDSEDEDEGDADGQRQQQRTLVKLQPKTPIKDEPSSSGKLLCKVGSDDEEFDVLGHEKKYVGLVVAGAGLGWAPTTAVSATRSISSSLVSKRTDPKVRTNGRVTSFTWAPGFTPYSGATERRTAFPMVPADHERCFLELLAIIGGPLKRLVVPSMHLNDAQFAHVLQLCPNLVELNVGGHKLQDITPLVERYRTGQCRIATLSLRTASGHLLNRQIVQQMTQVLQADQRHVLRDLVVDMLPPRYQTPEFAAFYPEVVVPFVQALNNHKNIQFIQLPNSSMCENFGVAGLPPVDTTASQLKSKFGSRAMTSRAKMALLSVVAHASETDCLSRLDASVLALIFALSRQEVMRHVLKDAYFV